MPDVVARSGCAFCAATNSVNPVPGTFGRFLARTAVALVAWTMAFSGAASAVTVQELVNRVSLEAMQAHVAALAGQRTTPEEQAAAATYIVGQLEASGYTVSRSPVINGDNLIARAIGHTDPDATFVIGAHYDSVQGSPGADDNATSVAALLEIARVLADADLGASVEFVAFADEELGLQGSRLYARATRESLRDVLGMFSFEMIAYTCTRPGCQVVFPDIPGCLDVSNANANVGTFIAAIGNDRSAALLQGFVTAAAQYVPDLQVETAQVADLGSCQPDTRRSDHQPYWEEGYPALMITDTANFRNPNYHSSTDTPDTLDFPFALRVAKAALGTVLDAVGLVAPMTPSITPTPVATATPTALPEGARPVLFIGRDFDEAVQVVDLANRDRIDALSVGNRPGLMTLSPDRRTLYVLSRERDFNSGDGGVTIVDLAEVAPPIFIPLGAPTSLAVSPDGLHLYVTNHPNGPQRTFEVIDTTTACRTTILSIDDEQGYLNGLRLDADGARGYVADPSGQRLLIVDLLTPRVTGSFEIGSPYVNDTPVDVEIDAAGAVAYVVNNTSGTVSMVDLATGAILKNVLVHRGARDVALTPDGTLGVVTASGAGDERGVDLFDTRTRRAVGSVAPPEGASLNYVAIGLDGLTAYVTGCGDDTLIIDLPSQTVTGTIPFSECAAPVLAAVLPGGTPPTRPTPLSDCPTPLRIELPPTATPTSTATFPTPTVTPTKTLSRTLTPSTTPVRTATRTAESTPTAVACSGDCDGNGEVTINELLRAVGVALELSPADACAAADADRNEHVSVDELIQAVNRALKGC